jgi:hypothetical protein
MYCRNCGQFIDNNSVRCNNCGEATGYRQQPIYVAEPIPTYLVHAILATLFCCMPFGIVAIVYAAMAQSKCQSGDIEGARMASQSACKWCWLSFWLGLLPVGIWLLVAIAGIASSGF